MSGQGDAPVERIVRKGLIDEEALGRPFSERVRQSRRTLENYLKAGGQPRWMERVIQIDRRTARERERLAAAYRELLRECGHDRDRFAERWRAIVAATRYDDLNELVRQHNEWYPIERDLPMDPRTGDYVPVQGRDYRRRELSPQWVLEQFPATPPSGNRRRVASAPRRSGKASAMQIPKEQILELLRARCQEDKAAQADGELPDQVDTDQHAGILEKLGLSPGELIGSLGGGGGAGGIGGKLGL